MPLFIVDVVKCLEVLGTIEIKARSQNAAIAKVERLINADEIQTVDPRIEWDEPEYMDFSFDIVDI